MIKNVQYFISLVWNQMLDIVSLCMFLLFHASVRNGTKLSKANHLILLFQVRTNPVWNLPNTMCLWSLWYSEHVSQQCEALRGIKHAERLLHSAGLPASASSVSAGYVRDHRSLKLSKTLPQSTSGIFGILIP